MNPNFDAKSMHFKRDRRTTSFRARAIQYGSYTEPVAARALVMIGLAVMAGVTVSIMVALAIL